MFAQSKTQASNLQGEETEPGVEEEREERKKEERMRVICKEAEEEIRDLMQDIRQKDRTQQEESIEITKNHQEEDGLRSQQGEKIVGGCQKRNQGHTQEYSWGAKKKIVEGP